MHRDDWQIYLKSSHVIATIFQMTGHTPGWIGMVVPVRYQGRQHPILLLTAATDVHNREAFVGGYEHIWDEGIKMKVENVMQAHPNTNMNLLARTKYAAPALSAGEKPAPLWRRPHRALHQHHAQLHAGADGDSRVVGRAFRAGAT